MYFVYFTHRNSQAWVQGGYRYPYLHRIRTLVPVRATACCTDVQVLQHVHAVQAVALTLLAHTAQQSWRVVCVCGTTYACRVCRIALHLPPTPVVLFFASYVACLASPDRLTRARARRIRFFKGGEIRDFSLREKSRQPRRRKPPSHQPWRREYRR